MQRPQILTTSAQGETFAKTTYHLDGELVPVLTVELHAANSIYFEHHTLLWKNTGVDIGVKSLKGAFKRMFAGMPIFMTEARGNGSIAFSRDGAGHIFPMHLKRGQELDVREHQFLAATDDVDYSFQMVSGVSNILFGGNGFFIDKFVARDDDGIVWLHGYGNVFEIVLGINEQIDVEPGAWLYKDPSVRADVILSKLSTGLFAGTSITMTRFTGPGRLGIQSMSVFTADTAQAVQSGQAATSTAATVGSVAGLASLALGMFGGNKDES